MACGLIEFASLYLDGKPVYPGTSYKVGKIEIGPTIQNTTISRTASKRLKWYFTGGRLIASEWIDGRDYKVRLLRAGREGRLSDWTNLLIVVRDQDFLLNWREAKSLGINQDKDDPRLKICWGGDQLGRCNYVYFNDQAPNFGWRPVLELPNLNGGAIRNLIGKDVLVRSRKGITIEGIIGDDTDYDLSIYGGKIISDNFKPEQEPQFLTFNRDHIVVNRAEILAIHPWDF